MTREDLMFLCNEYVRSRETAGPAGSAAQDPSDPSPEILRSFRLAEISECEMEALLSYVGDPDEEDSAAMTARPWLDWDDEPLPCPTDDEEDAEAGHRPLHPR
ncbi:MAG: hypothetical protein ACKOTB_04620 [Planctomycetia bacterium]